MRGTNKDRKCFQLVGDVLVEQTVADVLPKVEENEKGVSFREGFRGSASSLLHIQSNAHTPTTQISMMKKKLGEQLELIKKQLVDLQVRSLCVWCYSYFFLFTPFFCLLQKEYKGLSKQIAAQQSGQDGAAVATQSGTNAGGILA